MLFLLFALPSCQTGTSKEPLNGETNNAFIIDWNRLTYEVAYQHDQFYSLKGVRALAMTHLAMHDALNAVSPVYNPYAFRQKFPGADPIAAACQAAYDVLVEAYPKRADTIAAIHNKWLDQVRKGDAKKAGIQLGKRCARGIIRLREGDGHQKQGDYTPMSKPGDYQYTPGWNNWVLKPDFEYARPFALDSVTQFRAPAPPALSSEEYVNSFEEVKRYGAKDSKYRSEDQTSYAYWWAEFAEHSWNRIGRITARERQLPALETARMFALINMDIYDIYLASLESKYHYDTWRPYTAIRHADADGNPHTEADPDWVPEMLTPPWPEYPSAHASVGAGGAEIVAAIYGTTDIAFSMPSSSALSQAPERAFTNLGQAAQECADSRIMNGYHFRFATEAGLEQGRQVARYILANCLRPL